MAELKKQLLSRNHPEKVINYSYSKIFEPKRNKDDNKDIITFTRTYNPNHHFNYNRFNNCLTNIYNYDLQHCFNNKKILLTTRQPRNLKKMLVRAKFDLEPEPLQFKHPGLFTCKDCIHHKKGYILPTNSFSFKLRNGKIITWNYQKNFTCDSKNVLYILKCNGCDDFYLGQTKDLKQRISKHKSDIKHPHNSNCRVCAEHLRDCAKTDPYFQIYPFYYIKDNYFREFKEKRFIFKWKPPLNVHKT